MAPPSSSGKFEGLRSVAETVAHNNRRAEIKALLQAGVEAVPSRATLDLDNIADYLATCYPEGTLSPIHWVAPSQSIDDTTKEQFTHGHIFLFTGNFEQGQKFFYDTARQLDGDPATVLDQMRRLHGIGTLASEKIHAEFSNNIRLQGHSCFRFADILFWHRLEIAGLRYTFEHVLPQDAPNILSLNNAVMNEEKELLIDLNEMQDWVAKNPRTIVARNPQGGIVGFIFVSLLRSEDFPWTYKEMIQAHDSVHQATRNTMVDFWVVASRSVPGIGKNLPLMTEKLARQIGGIRYLIAYSRPAYLEQALIQDELEKHLARWEHIHGADRTALNASMEEWLAQCIQRDAAQIAGSVEGAEMWGVIADLHTLKDFELAYLRYRRILNRYHLRQTPRPSYESLFEGSDLNCYTPGQLDIYRYASQRHLLLSRPDRRTIHPKTGQAISYTRYLGLLDEKPEFLKHSKGLDRSMESYQYFVAPRGTDAYLQYRQSHPDVTLAQFCQRMGRTPEEKVLVGLHQGNNAVLAGEIFPGRPEDPRSLGCNSLTAYIGDINNIPALAHLPAPRNTRQPEIVPVQDALITGSM